MTAPRPIAAVDVGSNSIHLTVARIHADQRVEILLRLKDHARLAASLGADGRLPDEALDRAVATLVRFRDLAAVHGAEIRAAATAAVRRARNGHELIRRAAAEAGIEIRVVSGAEEARLTYRGVLHGRPELNGRRILCVDVGGGSSELLVGEGGRPLVVASVPLGSLLVFHRFLAPEPVRRGDLRFARRQLDQAFARAARAVAATGFEVAVGTSGTIQRLARIAAGLEGRPVDGEVDGAFLTRETLAAVAARLAAAPTRADRLRIPGLDPERADSLLGGALVFEALTRALPIDGWLVSTAALRTGLIVASERPHPIAAT